MVWRKFGVFVVLLAVLALPALANGTATLKVVKQVVGPAPGTPWLFIVDKQVDTDWERVTTFTLPAGGGQFVLVVEPGTYKIEETPKDGYTCRVNGEETNEATVTVESGDEKTVTFVNTAQPATITVVKEVMGPPPDTDWEFTVKKDGTTITMLTLPFSGGSLSFQVQPGATYTITETPKPGYTCTWAIDEGAPTAGNEAEVTVDPGDVVTVTFVNTAQPATITVVKEVMGPPPLTNWEFTVKKDGTTITMLTLPPSGGSLPFQVQPGATYTIIETPKPGYTCTWAIDEGGPTAGNEAEVTVDPGDEVTVTFVNTAKATLTVVKQVVGPEPAETWQFTVRVGEDVIATFNLPNGGGERTLAVEPGIYTIIETPKPGYTCTWAIDEGAPTAGNEAEVTVNPGDEVTVTFVNTAKATLTVVKQLVGPEPTETWQFTVRVGEDVIATFNLPAAGGQQDLALEPGTYRITETTKAGYICTVGGEVANQVTVTLTAGESKTVTFVNTKSQLANNSFPAGWNLLSVPFVPVPNTPAAVFDEVTPLYIFWWDPDQGKYVTPTQIDPGRGYWLLLYGITTIDVTGLVPEEDYEVLLGKAGWHMISTPTIEVFWRYCEFRVGEDTRSCSRAIEAEWIEPFFWQYDVATGQYVALGANPADVLRPWVGYWIKTLVDDVTVILPIKYMLTNPPVPPAGLALLGAEMPIETPPAPPSLAALAKDFLTVLAYPNPATASTVTFRALGLPVEAIRVSVFDLGGRKVWAGEAVGPTLAWNLADSSGRPLANGVYLYVVEARLGGQWVSTGLQRLVILR